MTVLATLEAEFDALAAAAPSPYSFEYWHERAADGRTYIRHDVRDLWRRTSTMRQDPAVIGELRTFAKRMLRQAFDIDVDAFPPDEMRRTALAFGSRV